MQCCEPSWQIVIWGGPRAPHPLYLCLATCQELVSQHPRADLCHAAWVNQRRASMSNDANWPGRWSSPVGTANVNVFMPTACAQGFAFVLRLSVCDTSTQWQCTARSCHAAASQPSCLGCNETLILRSAIVPHPQSPRMSRCGCSRVPRSPQGCCRASTARTAPHPQRGAASPRRSVQSVAAAESIFRGAASNQAGHNLCGIEPLTDSAKPHSGSVTTASGRSVLTEHVGGLDSVNH